MFISEKPDDIPGSKDFKIFEKRMGDYHVVTDTTTITVDTTTETENKTSIISSVWRKISNIFGGETTTLIEPEMRNEVLLPEDRKTLSTGTEGKSSRHPRFVPMDLNWRSEGEKIIPIFCRKKNQFSVLGS